MQGGGIWAGYADEELVVAALVGDLAAFDELVRRFRPAVRVTVRRYMQREDAVEDLCQEAFLRAFMALPDLEDLSRFGVWLHAIARNLGLRQAQNEARQRERFSPWEQSWLETRESLEPSPAAVVEQDETDEEVRRLVEALPEQYRVIVHLHYWERMPLPRAADYLGLPLTTVKWRLRRAQVLLRLAWHAPETVACGGGRE